MLHAKRMGLDLVASGALLDRLALPLGVEVKHCGDLAIRGKEARVAAYADREVVVRDGRIGQAAVLA